MEMQVPRIKTGAFVVPEFWNYSAARILSDPFTELRLTSAPVLASAWFAVGERLSYRANRRRMFFAHCIRGWSPTRLGRSSTGLAQRSAGWKPAKQQVGNPRYDGAEDYDYDYDYETAKRWRRSER